MRVLWRALLKQVLIIFLMAVFVGLVTNFFHPKGVTISLSRPPLPVASDSAFVETLSPVSIRGNEDSPDENDGEILIIKYEQLMKLFRDNGTILIDAREKSEFSTGHIPGAINIPYERYYEFEEQIARLPKDKWLICYCDGPPCDLGHLLAEELRLRNFSRVAFYKGGVDDWKSHGRKLMNKGGQK